ncbi:hypothetical protein C731_3101 [Mycolicibacterium hassiacum DSM 44199]|jgi:hypothetical protein|uniref:Uncharacterized protein n=2 Tax=Mycolicibacterium hassiacum TaxID=46351 RepID=K5B818_MYCHD|nr:hypothetical protein C731_3101 [Mycolicibacterium hassiacum DSM 44199]
MSGIDEHVTTLAVRGSGAAERVEMLGRELPPTEASNAAEPSARLGRPTAVAAVTIPEGARRGG